MKKTNKIPRRVRVGAGFLALLVLAVLFAGCASGVETALSAESGDQLSPAIGLCADSIMTYRYENREYLFEPEKEVSKIDLLVMMMCLRGGSADHVGRGGRFCEKRCA